MKTFIASLFFVTIIINVHAQKITDSLIKWQEHPSIHQIDPNHSDYPAVVIRDHRIMEHNKPTSNETTSYYTRHRIIHVINDAGIEKFNKVHIPLYNADEMISFRVRSVSPYGNVTELQEDDLRELENVEGVANVKIFAVEGVVVGGEIEYQYTIKGDFEPFDREIFQDDVPFSQIEYDLIYPDSWEFNIKSYNGLPDPESVKYDDGYIGLNIKAENIPAVFEEEYSAYVASLKKIDYKMYSNGFYSNVINWENVSERLLQSLQEGNTSNTIYKYLKKMKMGSLPPIEKIKKLESNIKSSISVTKGTNPSYSDIEKIISNSVGNEKGMAKLFVYCLNMLDIPNKLVFCSNRYNGTIDPDFANYTDITQILIYLPEYNSYIIPGQNHMRLGCAPMNVAGSTGLFLSYNLSLGDLKLKDFAFEKINPLSTDYVHQGVKATIDLTKDISLPEINQENYWQGYRAYYNRAVYLYADKSDLDEYIKEITLSSFENTNIINRSEENSDIELNSDLTSILSIKTNYTTPELVEKAGRDYLIAVGKIIGRQSELYQEKERVFDIAFHATANYNHEIKIIIPDGYSLKGLDQINISNNVIYENEDVMFFISNYTQEDNILTIKVNEVYKILHLPKEYYEDFRAVINSAANFNKLTLILQPDN